MTKSWKMFLFNMIFEVFHLLSCKVFNFNNSANQMLCVCVCVRSLDLWRWRKRGSRLVSANRRTSTRPKVVNSNFNILLNVWAKKNEIIDMKFFLFLHLWAHFWFVLLGTPGSDGTPVTPSSTPRSSSSSTEEPRQIKTEPENHSVYAHHNAHTQVSRGTWSMAEPKAQTHPPLLYLCRFLLYRPTWQLREGPSLSRCLLGGTAGPPAPKQNNGTT